MLQPRDTAALRLSLCAEGMRLQIHQVLHQRQLELQALVDDEVARVMGGVEGLVREAVREGTKRAITETVSAELYRLKEALQPGVAKAVQQILGTAFADAAPV